LPRLALAILLSLLAFPALAATPCALEISVSCASGKCTSTTTNVGTTACTGLYFAGMFTDVTASISGFTNTLGLSDCFDSGSFPSEGDGSFAFCFGDASLGPGASYTATATLSAAANTPSFPVYAITYVADELGEELAFVYALNDVALPTCTPVANVAPVTLTGVPYTVSWSEVSTPNATYIVEESTTPDFSAISASRTVQGTSSQFVHSVTSNTTYYYRVRAVQCSGAPGPSSATVSIAVQAVPPATTRGTDAVVPFGTTTPVDIPLAVNLNTAGAKALNGTNFTATTDKNYLTVTPSSGAIPSNGTVELKVTATPGSLPPGANTGTVKVVTNTGTTVAVPVSISLVTPVSPSGKSIPPANALIIPVVTHVVGFTGPFQSDVRLTNSSAGQVKYQVTYTPTRTDATTSSKATIVPVDPGTTIALNDVVKDFFGVGAGNPSEAGAGALEIRPVNNSTTLTYASSRTYVTTSKGTLGQFIAAVPFPLFASRAVDIIPIPGSTPPPPGPPTLSLQQVAESTKFRTNLGIVEGSGTPASGKIRVFNDAGQMLKELDFSLLPGEHQQMNQFISVSAGIPSLEDGRIEIVVTSDTGAVSAYASVLDNATTDPMAVMPVQPKFVQATRYVLPGMSELVSPFSNFHSDIRVYNGGANAVVVTPTFYPQTGGAGVAGAQFTLNAGEVRAVDNALPAMFNAPNGSGGSIVFVTNTPSSLVTTGRTYSNAAEGGTYGQFIPGVSPSQGIGVGDRALQILQLEQSQNFRANIGIAELSGASAEVRVSLVLPDSKVSPSTVVTLGPNQFTQLNRIIETSFGLAPGENVYNARVIIQVIGGAGRVTAYGSVIDNFTADPTYVPAQ
jgi:hypothetical protein